MKRVFNVFSIVAFVFALAIGNSYGQDKPKKYYAPDRAFHAEDSNAVRGDHGVGWVRSSFFDDWFFMTQGGGQLYYGVDDREGPFMDRLTGNVEFQFGRRIFPMFGFRIGVGYGGAHGFITKDHYNSYTILGGEGVCGTNPATGASLGGYYWDYNENLLIQKWKYFYFGADLFLDLAILRGSEHYEQFKPWNNIVYGGVHTRYSLSSTNDKSHRSEAHLGYICKHNFTHNWSMYADFRASAIERLFDREFLHGMESPGPGVDPILNLQIGIIYKFHFRDENQRSEFVHTTTIHDTAVTVAHVTYVKMKEVYTDSIKDTIPIVVQENTPTPDMQRKLDSVQALLDAELAKLSNMPWNKALDSIILNNLIPYEIVYFELDKWDIEPSEEMKIDKMSRIMKAYPDEKFLLVGSADSKTGTVQRNEFLSHNRADVVRDKLVNEMGIELSQLDCQYRGGILEYDPYPLNRCTLIIMDNPLVHKIFEEIKQQINTGKH